MEKPYREAGGPTEGMVNMEANRGASPRGFRAVSPVCTLETPKSALWQTYYLNSIWGRSMRRPGIPSVVRTRPHLLAAARTAAQGIARRCGQRPGHWTAARPQPGGRRRGMPGRQWTK